MDEGLKYAPNRLASGLRSKRSQIIGFVSDEICTTPYAGRVLLGAQEAAAANDQALMIVNTSRDDRFESRGIDALQQHSVDRIIYALMYHQSVQLPEALTGVLIALLDAYSDGPTSPRWSPTKKAPAAPPWNTASPPATATSAT